MENILLLTILVLLICGLGIFGFAIYKKISKVSDGNTTDNQSLQLLQNQIHSITQNLDYKLAETNKILQDQLSQSNQRLQVQSSSNNDLLRKISENNNKILQEVTEKLVKVDDTNKQIVNFAEQMQSLENILKNPKQRGILGEYFLETILGNVLPKSSFQIQYLFKDGNLVDAVIFAKDKIIPIDAKFSLEGFNRLIENKDPHIEKVLEKEFLNDIKKRIDETSKYVRPEENTIDVAFMFIPADGVYQELIRICSSPDCMIDIINYAYSRHVILVSPTSFFGYIQTVLQALNTLKVEERVKEIIKYLNESTKYLREFEENMNKLGKNIITLGNTFNRTSDDARKLTQRISKITKNEENLIEIEKVDNLVE